MTSIVIGSAAPTGDQRLDTAPFDDGQLDDGHLDVGRFGAGAKEPYDHALRRGRGVLSLHDCGPADRYAPTRFDVRRFIDDASEPERRLLGRLNGPVLDVGCGPGRLVKASILAGNLALGVDTSRAATELARGNGLPVLRRSVFHPLPNEGQWGAVLLIDGNIGIGGAPRALLQRCSQLVCSGGRIVVEAHDDAARDRAFSGIIADGLGRSSRPFPWAEVGVTALRGHAREAGLTLVREWRERHRSFAAYARG